jgi:predicted dinucleotide-binding enzyme
MKIGIIGSGNMGRSLGIFWAEQGHEVFFGARTAQKGQAIAKFADRKGKRSQSLLTERASDRKVCWTRYSRRHK